MTTKSKTRQYLVPQYMKDFQCIGAACEDSCCIGWRVNIDESTYKKYVKVRDEHLTPIIDKHVTRNRSNPTPGSYAKIRMGAKGACPFLSEEKLCGIQAKLGEEYLSNTCSQYPRINNAVNGELERSATTSCPEIARLVLLNPNGIEFEQHEEEATSHNIAIKSLQADSPAHVHKAQHYFWDLRIMSIQLLQNRSYRLHDRLTMLGMFLGRVQGCVDRHQSHQIPKVIEEYTAIVDQGLLREELDKIPTQIAVQLLLAKGILDQRFPHGVNSDRYLKQITKFLFGLAYTKESTVDELKERYTEGYEKYYAPFMDAHEYMLENYLVNYVYKNLFPFSEKEVHESYTMLVIHYAMIKLMLIGIARHHKGLNEELVVELIQSFSRTIEHSSAYLAKVHQALKDNELTSMAYMAILIKN
ncbi:flagellin lysine-N-methylase [Paenibacillus koleovorans]|uniref:flagellin lysine-N-methylase n=1 Tax=Paenibacillus koleovorans TaxID=121608 RepID=UPI000FDB22AA|nr:flagellin lysine-N-methylase [Paenibacillus koleovorans]